MHFVFKCKIINNAPILGELSYMLLSIGCLQLVFYPDDVPLWKKSIFSYWYFVCHREKCRGVLRILRYHFSFGIFLFLFPQSCFDLGSWYNLDNSLAFHSCEWLLGLIGVLSNLYLVWFFKDLCMHIYFLYLMACLISLIQYIG